MMIIIKSIITIIVLMFIGTNLVGMFFRNLILIFSNKNSDSKVLNEIAKEYKTTHLVNLIISLLLIIIYLFTLNYYFNYIISIVAFVFMLTRIPDLIFQIQTGEKLTKKNRPNRKIDIIFNLIDLLMIPIIWYYFKYYGL